MDVHSRRLRYFVTVAEELHFSRAAERLFVAQPAVSKQVRELEEELRVVLIERTSRSVRLTAAGQALLPLAQKILTDWDEAQRLTAAAHAASLSILRVGFVASAANEFTSEIVGLFAKRRPGWQVRMTQASWSDPTAGLADGLVDVALLRLPLPGYEGLLRCQPLFTEPRWLALSAQHPLAGRDRIDFAELLDEPFVATPPDSGGWRDYWLATECRGGRARPRWGLRSTTQMNGSRRSPMGRV